MADLVDTLLHLHFALTVAVVVVMTVRLPVRKLFGARVAYGLWILPVLTMLATLAPVRVLTVHVPAQPAARALGGVSGKAAEAVAPSSDGGGPLLVLWLMGAIASFAWLAWRQAQFARAAKAGRAGPAVVGVLRPRVVIPHDFADRYTPREREVVLAHELTHLERRDPPVNALLAGLTCVAWFNPAVHVMSRWLRIDQELACDARVVAAYPKARKAYAEALVKTQLAARPLPLGCHWSAHPLAQRVRLLTRPAPSRTRRLVGAALTLVLGGAAGGAVWAARPPVVRVVEAEVAKAPRFAAPLSPSAHRAPDAPPAPRVEAQTLPRVASPQRVAVVEPSPAPVDEEARLLAAPDVIPPVLPVFVRKPRVVPMIAERSSVTPGQAVRVVASGISPDGAPLWSDFTAFGSQKVFRKGAYERGGSRYSLFTSVAQEGERLKVTVSLGKAFKPELTASIDLVPGQTGVVKMPTGQEFVVTATVRPETPDEIEEGRQLTAYRDLFKELRPDRLMELRPDRPDRPARAERG